jgi:hypothetical protein
MRTFFLLLLFANLIFFAWTQGFLGTSDDGREPQRLAQQLHPEKLRIAPETRKPVGKAAELACRIINGLSLADAEQLKIAVEAEGGKALVSPVAMPASHLVVITELINKFAADKKAAELSRLKVEGHVIVALEDGRQEIVLGRFDTEPAAQTFLQALGKKGIKSARAESREQPATKARVEARAPASTLLQQLPKLIAPYPDATIGECVT